MKIRVKAIQRGTRVSPSTGGYVHFNPDAKNPLLKRPMVDERDVQHFVDNGMCQAPKGNPHRIGLEEERALVAEHTSRGRRAEDVGAERVAKALGAETASGPLTSGLDTRQTRQHDPASGIDKDHVDEGDEDEDERGEGGEGGEGGDEEEEGLRGDDPDAPPAAGAQTPPRGGRRRRGRAAAAAES